MINTKLSTNPKLIAEFKAEKQKIDAYTSATKKNKKKEESKKQQEQNLDEGIYAEFTTNYGNFTARLFYETAPITVANFIGLAEGIKEFRDYKTGELVKRPFYEGLIFHRVIDNFMIQGGCPLGTGVGGPGYSIKDEFSADLNHNKPGVISMANAGPNTGGSQFFITLAGTPWLNNKHSVFGEVINGFEVVQKIGKVKKGANDKPLEDVKMSIKIKRVGDNAEKFDIFEAEKLAQAKTEALIKQFQEKLADDLKNATTTPSGLKYIIKKTGSGLKPQKGDIILAHYTGYLENGKKFDSSIDRNQPFKTQIGVGRVIAGWDEAFLQMQIGEQRRLIIPPALGYGARNVGPIPANSTLIFDVELIDIIKN